MGKFEKGSIEWAFFADLFTYCKKYSQIGQTVEYWNGLTREGSALVEKYRKEDQTAGKLANHMVCGFIDYLDEVKRDGI